MKLLPEEIELRGRWKYIDRKIVPAEVCERINRLTDEVLERVAESPKWGAWEALYQDPGDGRLWELRFPPKPDAWWWSTFSQSYFS